MVRLASPSLYRQNGIVECFFFFFFTRMTENKFAYTKVNVCMYVHEYIIIDDIIMVLRESLEF